MNLGSVRRIDPAGPKGLTVYFSETDSMTLSDADAEALIAAPHAQGPSSRARRAILSQSGKAVIFWFVVLAAVLLVYLAITKGRG